ncbi:MAG: CoA ester lyase [Sinimarinibacterium sp.]|jgi:citrate lyase subunit beta/citryl-CoA lyase
MNARGCDPTLAGARSFLFVPADRPERIGKALDSGADVVIVDLEDAVAPDVKDAARKTLAAALSPSLPVLVRVNAAGTPWFERDLELCRAREVSGVVLPKAERTADLDHIAQALGEGASVLCLIETAAGLWNALPLAQHAVTERLLFGSIDLQSDLGIDGDREEVDAFRSQLVLASRLAQLPPPVDGVTTSIDDVEQIRSDARRARRFGFGGKLCIHPRQIATVNGAFDVTPAEVQWAERVIDAIRHSKGAAVAFEGRMIDRPVVARAEAILRARRSRRTADGVEPSA